MPELHHNTLQPQDHADSALLQQSQPVSIHSGFLPIDPTPHDTHGYHSPLLDLPAPIPAPPHTYTSTSPSPTPIQPAAEARIPDHPVDWNWGPEIPPTPPTPTPTPILPSAPWPIDAVHPDVPLDYLSHSPPPSLSRTPAPSPSLSSTSSPSRSPSPSPSPSRSPSPTPTSTRSPTPSPTTTPSTSPTSYPSHSMRASHTPRPSPSTSPSETAAPSPSRSPSMAPSYEPYVFSPHPMEAELQEREDKVDWSYDVGADDGPVGWANLDSTFSSCNLPHQSPIDLTTLTIASPATPLLSLSYPPSILLVRNTGNYLRAVPHQGGTATLTPPASSSSRPFQLTHVSVHTPSEHAINGESFPMEIQLHHVAAEGGGFLSIALLLDAGAGEIGNPFVEKLLENAPAQAGETLTEYAVDLAAVLPVDLSSVSPGSRVAYPYLGYDGSGTAPPCSAGVRWAVWPVPGVVSARQVERVVRLVGEGARPLQDVQGREVVYKSVLV